MWDWILICNVLNSICGIFVLVFLASSLTMTLITAIVVDIMASQALRDVGYENKGPQK